MMDIDVLPGGAYAWPDAAVDWLQRLGCPASEIQETLVSVLTEGYISTLSCSLLAILDDDCAVHAAVHPSSLPRLISRLQAQVQVDLCPWYSH